MSQIGPSENDSTSRVNTVWTLEDTIEAFLGSPSAICLFQKASMIEGPLSSKAFTEVRKDL